MIVSKQFEVEFRKDGQIHEEAQVAAVLAGLAGVDHLVVMAHGWNNDKADATTLYDAFVQSVEDVAEAKVVAGFGAKRLGLVRLYWPSKKFADEDLIPGGGAASVQAAAASDAATARLLDELANDPLRLGERSLNPARAAQVAEAKQQLPQLSSSPAARKAYVQAIRALLDPDEATVDDGSAAFFTIDPEQLFEHLDGPVPFVAAPARSGAVSVAGGAAGVGDFFSGVGSVARRIANYATYYQMKSRAGTVGSTGVAVLLARIRQAAPALPLTLVGHSFGGRLVTAAAASLPPGSAATTMMLLQAAFSHNSFAEKFDSTHDGGYRTVLADKRLSGPIVITHTKNDRAVGIAYPLASRIAFQQASALGDENDPYGGLGRNGALHLKDGEVKRDRLHALGTPYQLTPGTVFNLQADEFIADHGAVTGHQVAYAFAHVVTV